MQTSTPIEADRSGELTRTQMTASAQRARLIGIVCVVLTALGWGLNWPATKFLLTICPPLSARGVSGLVAGLILFGVAASCGETLIVPRHLWGRLATAALLNVTAWMGFTTASLVWLPAGQAATLAYTMPVWAVLLTWALFGERPVSGQILGIVLSICGVIVLLGGRNFELNTTRMPGIVLAVSAAFLFALGAVLSKQMPIPLPRIALTAWQVALGCMPLLAGGLLFEQANFVYMPVIGWIAMIYTAFISMGLCYLLWFAAVRRLTASNAAIGTLLTPCVGVIASSVTLGDTLTLSQSLSLGLVGAGILLAIKT